MAIRSWYFIAIFVVTTWISAGAALAGSGTLKGSFYVKDPTAGDIKLSTGYVYLHNAVNPPPMEKFFSKADFIFVMTASPFSFSVPEGSYYIRILQRKPGTTNTAYGPPKEGDYTWIQQTPIQIVSGATLDLGKKYASTYSVTPISITGTVTSAAGVPLAGQYVRAQVEQCLAPVNCTDSGCEQYGNQCGAVKYLALSPTDANGKYTLYLADSGSYYIYSSPCLIPGHNLNEDDMRCQFTPASDKPITVKRGDRLTVNVVVP